MRDNDHRPYLTLAEVITDGLLPHRLTAADLRRHPLLLGLIQSENQQARDANGQAGALSSRRVDLRRRNLQYKAASLEAQHLNVDELQKSSIYEKARQKALARLLDPSIALRYEKAAERCSERAQFLQTISDAYAKFSELAKSGKVEVNGKPNNSAISVRMIASEFEHLSWSPLCGDDLVNKANKTVWSQVFINCGQLRSLADSAHPMRGEGGEVDEGLGRPRIHPDFRRVYLELKRAGELPKGRQLQSEKVKTIVRNAAKTNGRIPPNNPEDTTLKSRFAQWDKDNSFK